MWPFKKKKHEPCKHLNAVTKKWVENETPMIDWKCPDCGASDYGHVYADIDGWAD